METNLIFIILFIVCLVAFVIYGNITAVKLGIQREKNRLFVEFAKRTAVRPFLKILDQTSPKAIDAETMMMLQKYFDLVLNKIQYQNVGHLLADLDKSLYADILLKSLRNAAADAGGIFGLALAAHIDNDDKMEKLRIERFMDSLPAEQRASQYTTALNQLSHYYNTKWIDYPSEYQKPIKEAMEAFEEIIKQQ